MKGYSAERYFDTETNRLIAVGRHDERLIMVPYEAYGDTIITNEQIRNEIL